MEKNEPLLMRKRLYRTCIFFLSLIIIVLILLIGFIIKELFSTSSTQNENFPDSPSDYCPTKDPTQPLALNDTPCTAELKWFPDARQMYNYQLKTEIVLYKNELEPQESLQQKDQRRIAVDITGTLNFRVFQKPDDWPVISDDNLIYVAFQLSPVSIQYAEGDDSLSPQKDLKSLFQTLFCASFLRNGLCFQLYFPSNLDQTDRSSLSEIVYSSQLVFSDKTFKKWTTKERHSSGQFLAEYRMKGNDCQLFEKQNVRCISLNTEQSENNLSTQDFLNARIIESQFTLSVTSTKAWIESCRGQEHIEFRKTDNDHIWSSSKMQIQMNLIPFHPDQNLHIWSAENDLETLLLSFFETHISDSDSHGTWKKRRIETIKNRLNNRTLFQLISDLELALSENKDQSYNSQLSHMIQDYFIAFPEAVYQVPFLLENNKISNSAVGHLMLALERSGHSQAQTVLKNIMLDNQLKNDYRIKAIVAAGSVDSPTELLTDGLIEIVQQTEQTSSDSFNELTSTALLALGIHCQTYENNGQTEIAEQIVNQLTLDLIKSQNPTDKVIYFKAIGNAKNTQFIKVIESYLPQNEQSEELYDSDSEEEIAQNQDIPTQIAAIMALGQQPETTEGIDLIIPLFDHERKIIRAAAVDAITNMNSEKIVNQLCERLSEENDETIRRKIIQYLGDHITETVVETLKNHLDLSHQYTDRQPISRDEAEDIYRALIKGGGL